MDIRWIQRFSNFLKAFEKLKQSVDFIEASNQTSTLGEDTVLSEMIQEGLIQRFEYTHELAWNVMKDYAAYQGNFSIAGSRDAIREAFKMQLISEGQIWMDMISSRNKTSYTYNQIIADEIYVKIIKEYFRAFSDFKHTMFQKLEDTQSEHL